MNFRLRHRLPLKVLTTSASVSRASMLTRATMGSVSVMMPFPMMVTVNVRVKGKLPIKQRLHRFIRTAGYPAVKSDARLRQSSLRTCPYPSANQRIHV